MSTINYPRISRKKEVDGKYNPNSFRVISNDAEVLNLRYKDSHPSYHPRLPDLPIERKPNPSDHRFHNPHPYNCDFLRQNVRFVNEPVCTVYTTDVRQEQPAWWPSRTSNAPLQKPPFTYDTTFRRDYIHDTHTLESKQRRGFSRHQSNPNKYPVLGAVPVNHLREQDGSVRVHKENISYEHQYNSRLDPNYPTRGKRHGSFVWDKLAKEKAAEYLKSINHPVNFNEIERPSKPEPQSPTFKVDAPVTTTTKQIPATARVPSPPEQSIPCKQVIHSAPPAATQDMNLPEPTKPEADTSPKSDHTH